MNEWRKKLIKLRQQAVANTIASSAHLMSEAIALTKLYSPEKHAIEVRYNQTYTNEHALGLDIYRPINQPLKQPALIYFHGGGFTSLSKQTHAAIAVKFANMGFIVFNVDYRLAPEHPFPAAIEDAASAYAWIINHAEEYHADIDQLILAGESAGANLVTTLTLLSCFERDESYAQRIYQSTVVPKLTMPICGLLDVLHPEALIETQSFSFLVKDRLRIVSDSYLGDNWNEEDPSLYLSSPLLLLESNDEPNRKLPFFHITTGSSDPVMPHSERLSEALKERNIEHFYKIYPKAPHAFNAFIWKKVARDYWREVELFLKEKFTTTF